MLASAYLRFQMLGTVLCPVAKIRDRTICANYRGKKHPPTPKLNPFEQTVRVTETNRKSTKWTLLYIDYGNTSVTVTVTLWAFEQQRPPSIKKVLLYRSLIPRVQQRSKNAIMFWEYFGEKHYIRHLIQSYTTNNMDVVTGVNIKRHQWFSHEVQIKENVLALRVFDAGRVGESRCVCKDVMGQTKISLRDKVSNVMLSLRSVSEEGEGVNFFLAPQILFLLLLFN